MAMFDINHIHRITLERDNLESFQSNWTMVMSEFATAPDHAILQLCYFRQIHNFKPMADDDAYYKRARLAADATDHSIVFVLEAATRYLRMKREDSMHEQFSRGFNGAGDKALPGIDPRRNNSWKRERKKQA